MHQFALTNRWPVGAVVLGLVVAGCAAPARAAEADWGVCVSARTSSLTPELRKLSGPAVQRVEAIDFTGDGVEDFIVSVDPDQVIPGRTFSTKELWITSDYRIVRTPQLFRTPIFERWFVNLDADPEPEIVTCAGYEDGIDYWIDDQTDALGRTAFLFRFLPVASIEDADEGPRAVWIDREQLRGTAVRRVAAGHGIVCSFDYDSEALMEMVQLPPEPPQTALPLLFFALEPADHQAPTVLALRSTAPRTLEEMVAQSRAVPASQPTETAGDPAAAPTVQVDGPVVIAFYPHVSPDDAESDQGLVEILGDFGWHLRNARPALEAMGVTVHERAAGGLPVEVAGEAYTFTPPGGSRGVGYYLIAPGRERKVLTGVHTDVDLVVEMRRYLDRPPPRLTD